jgi:hypothetical protein
MSNHTPGPWVFNDEGEGIFIHAPQSRKYVCDVTVTNPVYAHPESAICNAEALTNARLIAAAPDMLAALKLAEQNAFDQTALAAIRAAIAKAQGGAV